MKKVLEEASITFKISEHGYYEDIVRLPLTPEMIGEVEREFEILASKETNYHRQGIYREIKDYFCDAYYYWKKMRNEVEEAERKKEEKK